MSTCPRFLSGHVFVLTGGNRKARWDDRTLTLGLPRLEEELGPADDLVCVVKPVDDARQIDANAGMSAPKNEAKCLKGQKSQRNGDKNGVMVEDYTQKSLLQTIRLYKATIDELFRPSLAFMNVLTLYVEAMREKNRNDRASSLDCLHSISDKTC